MSQDEFILTSQDGLELKGKMWIPEKQPKAVVCLIHGMGEHQDRYAHVAALLTDNDFTLFSFDLRGHGKSQGKRGHTPSYNHLLNDVENLLKRARQEYNDLPIFLYGHSMGGNVVANFLLRRATSELTGAVVTSPFLRLAFEPPAGQLALGRVMNKLFPSFTQSNGLDVSDLSTDEQIGEAYVEDPLVHDKISAGMFFAVFEAGQWAIENASSLKIPVLLMHGKEDRITSPEGTKAFAENAGALAELQLWDGMKHETHNEIGKERVLAYLVDWLEAKLETP